MDLLIAQRRAVFAGPGDARLITDLQKQPELLIKEGVVVAQVESEERVGLREGTASGHDLGTSFRNQVEGGEFLKDPHRIGGTQHGDGTRQADPLRARGGGGKQDDRSRIEKLLAVVLADAEDIEPRTVGGFHFFQKIPQPHDRINQGPRHGISQRGDEAIDAYLHAGNPRDPTNSGKTKR